MLTGAVVAVVLVLLALRNPENATNETFAPAEPLRFSRSAPLEQSNAVENDQYAEPVGTDSNRAERTSAPPKTEEQTIENAQPTWPYDPRTMEGLILAELQSLNLPTTGIDPIECTETECKIGFESREGNPYEDYAGGIQSIIQEFLDGPVNAVDYGFGGSVVPQVGFEHEITLLSYERERARADANGFFIPADELLSTAETDLGTDNYDSGPVPIRPFIWNGQIVSIMAENVCAYDCELDGRQVIYIDIPDGVSCNALQGVEQRIPVRTQNGGIDERSFCIPGNLFPN